MSRGLLRAPAREGIDTLRELRLERKARVEAGRGERAYGVYLAVLVILTMAPSGFAAAHYLLTRSGFAAAPVLPAAALGVGTVAVTLAAHIRGPVAATLPDIDHVLSTPLDRAAIHRRTGLLWIAGFAISGAIVTGVLAALDNGLGQEAAIRALSGAGAGLGLYLWFAGAQMASSAGQRWPYVLVLAASVATALAGMMGADINPAAWAPTISDMPMPRMLTVALILSVTSLLFAGGMMLNRVAARRITREHLRGQEWAWSSAKMGAITVNPQVVAEAVVRERNYGRHLRLGMMTPWLHVVVARDLLGALRRWPRSTLALLVAAVAAAVFSTQSEEALGWILCAGLLTVAARGSATGLRSHADNAGRSLALEPQNTASLVAHLVVPLITLVVGSALGLAGAWILGSALSPSSWGLLALVLVAVLVQGVPAYATELPLYLMGPIVTPVGDLSPLAMTAWLLRAYALTLAAAWTMHTAASFGLLSLAGWAVGWALAASIWSWKALRQGRGTGD